MATIVSPGVDITVSDESTETQLFTVQGEHLHMVTNLTNTVYLRHTVF